MATIGRGMTNDHATVNNRVANTEPENDGELVQFFMAEAAGLLGYAQAWEQFIEHLLAKVGLDPASMQGAHDIHQAAAECAQLTTKAVQRVQGDLQRSDRERLRVVSSCRTTAGS